jgi:hypothetical protein
MVALARAVYEVDTFVITVDVPDPEPEGRRMQVLIDSGRGLEWCRRKLTRQGRLPQTACGQPIDPALVLRTRYESYEGRLCRHGCFTVHELADSAEINAEIDRDP